MITDELERLASLHRTGSLTDAEFAAAKERVLSGAAPVDADVERENALTRLDVAWLKTQQDYSRWRRGYLPTENTSLQLFVVIGIVVVLGLTVAASLKPSRASIKDVIFFMGLIPAVIVGVVHELRRTRRYLTAERAYQLERGRILDGTFNRDTLAATVEVRQQVPPLMPTCESTPETGATPAGSPRIHPGTSGSSPTQYP
jgi:hypothetical protein